MFSLEYVLLDRSGKELARFPVLGDALAAARATLGSPREKFFMRTVHGAVTHGSKETDDVRIVEVYRDARTNIDYQTPESAEHAGRHYGRSTGTAPGVVVPSVTLHGTSAGQLDEKQREVQQAARALLTALENAEPNARDYLTPEAFRAAVAWHLQRVARAETFRTESALVRKAIADQVRGR